MRNTKPLVLIWLIVFTAFPGGPAYCSSADWGPWDQDRFFAVEQEPAPLQTPRRKLFSRLAVYPGILLISFFQTVISPVDGASCDFYPTCSAYAKQALQKHGLFIGLVMASERLCRLHSPEGYAPVEKFGSYYYHDPVENNDFWFAERRAGTP